MIISDALQILSFLQSKKSRSFLGTNDEDTLDSDVANERDRVIQVTPASVQINLQRCQIALEYQKIVLKEMECDEFYRFTLEKSLVMPQKHF